MQRGSFLRQVVAIAAVIFFVVAANAANRCVGPSATGSGSGADWNNKMAWTSTPARGDTWYLEDGSYPAKTFSTPVSGSTLITVKKATASDHVTEAGWDSGMGDGQAIINSTIRFTTAYWVLDGSTRNEADWLAKSAYGIKIAVNGQLQQVSINDRNVDYITLRYVHVEGLTSIGTANAAYQSVLIWPSDYGSGSGTFVGYLFQRCLFSGSVNSISSHNNDGLICEYSAFADTQSNANNHGENFGMYYDCYNYTVRHNLFTNCAGTAIMAINGPTSGHQFYGNVVVDCDTSDGTIGFLGNGALNCKFYNNTIVKGRGYNSGTALGSGGQVYNNIFIDNRTVSFAGSETHNYNTFSDGSNRGEANAQINVSGISIFNNYAGGNYTLKAAMPGMVLASPYNTDILGNTRGSDGTFDRGAYEFGGVADTTPPVISSVGASSITSIGAVIAWTTSEAANSVVEYGTTTAYGLTVNNASLVLPHTVALAGLTPNTLYHYRVRSTDAAGNVSTSGDFTFTTAIADITAPTVTLTAPASGVVSNSVTCSATASDNIGVIGVKFFVNGNQVFDDTASPYSYSWDSTANTNGSYKIYAQARDAAGNIKWSGTNTVTVNNAAGALPSPSAYWSFDEGSGTTASDPSSGSVLTLRNGVTWTAGKTGSALLLDGVNDRADAPNNSAFDYVGNQITVAAWVKLENLNNWQQIVVKLKETGTATAPYLSWHLFAGTVSATQWRPQWQLVTEGDNSVNVSSTTAVNYSEWVHMVGVYDGAALRIYVNGVEQGNAPQSGNIIRYNQPLYVGAHGQPGEFGKGAIDELRIYSRALSATQIQSLYSAGVGSIAPPTALRVVAQ